MYFFGNQQKHLSGSNPALSCWTTLANEGYWLYFQTCVFNNHDNMNPPKLIGNRKMLVLTLFSPLKPESPFWGCPEVNPIIRALLLHTFLWGDFLQRTELHTHHNFLETPPPLVCVSFSCYTSITSSSNASCEQHGIEIKAEIKRTRPRILTILLPPAKQNKTKTSTNFQSGL